MATVFVSRAFIFKHIKTIRFITEASVIAIAFVALLARLIGLYTDASVAQSQYFSRVTVFVGNLLSLSVIPV